MLGNELGPAADGTDKQDAGSPPPKPNIISKVLMRFAIQNQSLKHLEKSLKIGWDVNEILASPIYGGYHSHQELVHRTALHEAARRGWTEGVERLLDAGAKCKRSGTLENHLALALQDEYCPSRIIELLLKHGADPNDHGDRFEQIPLLCAIANYQDNKSTTDIVQLLLQYGANPNVSVTRCYGEVYHDNKREEDPLSLAKLMVMQLGSDSEQDMVQITALHETARQGWTEGLKMLLDAGAKGKRSGTLENPLALVLQSEYCPVSAIELLLKHGADPNDHGDRFEQTPLLSAIANCRYNTSAPKIVQLLLQHGANPNVSGTIYYGDKDSEKTREECSLSAAIHGSLSFENFSAVFKSLVHFGADVRHNKHVNLHNMICRYPARSPHYRFLQEELDLFFLHGGNIDMEDNLGTGHGTPLEFAVRRGDNPNSVRWLIRHGADTSLMKATLLKEHLLPQDCFVFFHEVHLILLQAGMRISSETYAQLSNMERAISTWLQDGTKPVNDIFTKTKAIWILFEKAEREGHERMQYNFRKSTIPEYFTQQGVDLQEFSDDSLHVYPVRVYDDFKRQEVREVLDKIHAVQNFLSETQSLQWYCRRCVRENLVSLQPSVVKKLPIPARLKRYILCHEI